MVLQLFGGVCIIAGLLVVIFGIMIPTLKRDKLLKNQQKETYGDIDSLVDESEKVYSAHKKVKSKINKTEEKLGQIKNKLKNN